MTYIDPKTIGISAERWRAVRTADNQRRIAVLERSGPASTAGSTPDLSPFVRKDTVLQKGDILVATGPATLVRLAVGTDGQVLIADSSTATGLAWATVSTATFPTYQITNAVTDYILNCNSTSLHELADVFASLVSGYVLNSVPTFSFSNGTIDRNLNCSSFTLHELADVVYTVYSDLTGATSGIWTVSNLLINRNYDANSVTENTLANTIGTFIDDLVAAGDL